MLLAGCGASPSAAPSPSPAQPAGSASAAAKPSGSGAASAAATANTLRYDIGDEPESIDPAQDQDTTQDFVIMQLNATLVYPDKDLNIKPGLAEKWDISSDGLRYTFHLRQGMKWSAGTAFTAKDFEYSFMRLFDPVT